MKKQWTTYLRAAVLAFVLALALGGCRAAFFAGTSDKDSNQLDLSFTSMNTTETQMFKLYAGNRLEGNIEKKAGEISVQIKIVGGDTVYEDKDADSGSFTVEAPESGSYWVSVTGHEAQGRVRIALVEEEES